MEKLKNKKVIIPAIIIVLVIALGLTYAWFVWTDGGNQTVKIKGGSLDLELDEKASNGISIDTAIPMSDSQATDAEYTENLYTFSVVNNGTVNASYELFLDNDGDDTTLSDSNIKYSITRNDSNVNLQLLSNATDRKIDEAIVNAKQTNTYTLRLWIDSETTKDVGGQVFKGKLRLVGQQTEDSASTVYSISGQIVDNDSNPVSNANVVVYSDPTYVTTNAEGNFSADGLEYGIHTVYYVPGKTEEELKLLTKEQIESITGVGKATVSTYNTSEEIELSNGYKIINTVVSSRLIDASMIQYEDTYNMGCDNVACALDKLRESLS